MVDKKCSRAFHGPRMNVRIQKNQFEKLSWGVCCTILCLDVQQAYISYKITKGPIIWGGPKSKGVNFLETPLIFFLGKDVPKRVQK